METAMIQTTEFEATQTIDPRDAKLRDIIEKGKASLQKTLEEIQHEFAIREDMAVRPTAIDFLVQDHKIQPVIRDEAYDLTDHSQGQMLTRAGIPAEFAQKLMDLEENELLSRNLVELKTSSMRFTDDQIDLDLQGTLYSCALKQIGFRTNGDETLVRDDQLLKLKNPDMETHYAVKGNVDYTWAYHLVRKVLRAIDHEVYHPIPGWQCKDCPYGRTC